MKILLKLDTFNINKVSYVSELDKLGVQYVGFAWNSLCALYANRLKGSLNISKESIQEDRSTQIRRQWASTSMRDEENDGELTEPATRWIWPRVPVPHWPGPKQTPMGGGSKSHLWAKPPPLYPGLQFSFPWADTILLKIEYVMNGVALKTFYKQLFGINPENCKRLLTSRVVSVFTNGAGAG